MADLLGGSQQIQGATPHDDVDGGNPVKIGGKASTSLPTAVADGDRVDAYFDEFGRQVVKVGPTTITGSLSSNGTLSLSPGSYGAVAVEIAGTFVASVRVQGSADGGVTWNTLRARLADSPNYVTSVTSPTVFRINSAGYGDVRVEVFGYTSGTVDLGISGTVGHVHDGLDTIGGNDPDIGIGDSSTGTQRVVIAAAAHDAADTGNPVKIGGHATVARRTVVDEDDRVDASFDLWGQLRVSNDPLSPLAVAGNVQHDSPDSGRPVPIGGRADEFLPADVATSDRVRASFDRAGRQRVLAGGSLSDGGVITAAAQDIELVLEGFGNVGIVISGTWTGTLEFEGAIDAITFFAISVLPVGPEGARVATTTANGQWMFPAGGLSSVRVRSSAWTSGVAVITLFAGTGVGNVPSDTISGVVYSTGDGVADTGSQRVAVAAAAHDAADAGNPVKIGGKANAALPTAVDENDRVQASFDLQGQLRITNESSDPLNVTGSVDGNVAHDAADAGNPVGVGFNAVESAADPPQVSTDGDRVRGIATPQGIQYMLEGHPNIISREYVATGVQTDDPIIDAVAAGSHIVLFSISAFLDGDTTSNTKVRIGFGAANVPTEPGDGASVDGMALTHPGIAPGSGVVDPGLQIGGDGEELRITNETPTPGRLTVRVKYIVSTL